jgi:hypothetical protein
MLVSKGSTPTADTDLARLGDLKGCGAGDGVTVVVDVGGAHCAHGVPV